MHTEIAHAPPRANLRGVPNITQWLVTGALECPALSVRAGAVLSLTGAADAAASDAAIVHGAVARVRPKLMTVIAIMAGLMPILWSQETGADVMKRIAAPMVGGMMTSTVLTLLVIPAIYSLWKERVLHRATPLHPDGLQNI